MLIKMNYRLLEAWRIVFETVLTVLVSVHPIIIYEYLDTVPSMSHAKTAIAAACVQADSSVTQ